MPSKPIVFLSLLLMLIVVQSCKDKSSKPPDGKLNLDKLPMIAIDLKDLSSFKSPGKNWQLAEQVLSDFQKEHDLHIKPGNGVVVNVPGDSSHLFTNFEHGDLELELDFMMPKGSNSGVYFQGRYEVQLFDSWNVNDPKFSDCGGIYQRWDDTKPEPEKGYEGHSPKVNACKAPGLWQHLKIYFKAPRFDENGNKIANARFDHVYLNDYLIQENVEVTGPTRAAFYNDEKAMGPLMIQGDHGSVALKNIRYKSYTLDSLSLKNISYDVYDGTFHKLPDFSKLTPVKSGTSNVLNVAEAAGKNEYFGLVYKGDLNVPVTGEYLFNVFVDEGGEMSIDGKSILKQDSVPGGGTVNVLVSLTKGVHQFEFKYYQFTWNNGIVIHYEGPGISRKPLTPVFLRWGGNEVKEQLVVNVSAAPEMVRSFISYKDTVKTHVISMGDPMQVHYAFDMERGTLLKVWKGVFADVFGMWHDRGESQLLQPGNFAIDIPDGPSLVTEDLKEWSQGATDFRFHKYTIDKTGHPVFQYQQNGVTIVDQILPSTDSIGLVRKLKLTSPNTKTDLFYRLAYGEKVEKLSNGYYNIDGSYYLRIDKAEGVQEQSGKSLIVPVLKDNVSSEIQYTIVW